MDRKIVNILLNKYIDGTLSATELEELKTYISDEKLSLDNELEEAWNEYIFKGKRNEKAYRDINKNIHRIIQPKKERKIVTALWRGVAAVLLPAAIIFSFHMHKEKVEALALNNSFYKQKYEIITTKGERVTIILPDSTEVRLNGESKLTYPVVFDENSRTVYLDGEGHFDVTHNPNKPFIVETYKMNIKVLGTSFNVYANKSKDIFESTLFTGKIEVLPKEEEVIKHNPIVLMPNEKISYNSEKEEVEIRPTPKVTEETGWWVGTLTFRKDKMEDILDKLASFYGLSITVEGNLPTRTLTGDYNEEDVVKILENLQEHYSFSYTKTGNKINLIFK